MQGAPCTAKAGAWCWIRVFGMQLKARFGAFGHRSGLGLSIMAVVAVAGCDVAGTGRIRTIPIIDGAVVASAPSGYCISPGAGMRGDDSAVILMGRCSGATSASALPAIITLSVGPAASAGVLAGGGEALAAFFQSEAGRAALAREGRAEDVRVLSAAGTDATFVLHVADNTTGEYWRAFRGLRGRLATVSVTGSPDAPLTSDQSRSLLDATLAALDAANRLPVQPPA